MIKGTSCQAPSGGHSFWLALDNPSLHLWPQNNYRQCPVSLPEFSCLTKMLYLRNCCVCIRASSHQTLRRVAWISANICTLLTVGMCVNFLFLRQNTWNNQIKRKKTLFFGSWFQQFQSMVTWNRKRGGSWSPSIPSRAHSSGLTSFKLVLSAEFPLTPINAMDWPPSL